MPGIFSLFAELVERFAGAPVGVVVTEIFDNETERSRFNAFPVVAVYAVVSDEGVRHQNDLTAVGVVRKDLLVAGSLRC